MMAHSFTSQVAFQLFGRGGVTVTTDRMRDVYVRQASVEDTDLVWDMHCRLSEGTIRLRYGAPKHLLPEPKLRLEMDRMLGGEPQRTTTLVGTVEEGGARCAVSLVQLVQYAHDRTTAEIAMVVRDDYQREGLGRSLSRLTRFVALARGVRTLEINTLVENQAIKRLIRGFSAPYIAQTRRGETTITLALQ
jgi:RimJ/RimL family protein N-acetyltransferase